MASKSRTDTYAELPNQRRPGSTRFAQRREGDPSTRTWRDPATGEEASTAGPGGPNGRPILPMRADRDSTDDEGAG